MNMKAIEERFKNKVSQEIRLEKDGIHRYRVFTPFTFDDGDHLSIILRMKAGEWAFTDEGHTYMHLTYALNDADLYRGSRQKIIGRILTSFNVEDQDGELRLPVEGEEFGEALFTFVQALHKITDISFLSSERVRSTFLDDFRKLIEERIPQDRLKFDWTDPKVDPHEKYPIDCRINGMREPLFVFALLNDDRVRDATITLHHFERAQVSYRSLAVFEDQTDVNRKVLARFSDICDKQFSNLSGDNRNRIVDYIAKACKTG